MKNILSLSFSTIIVSFVLAFSIQLVFAWTEPSSSPPGGNVAAPINVSGTTQTKTGNLALPNLYLNAAGNEGNIYSTNIIQGYNDLILYGNASKNVPIYLEGNPVVINNDAGTGNVGIGPANPGDRLHIYTGPTAGYGTSGGITISDTYTAVRLWDSTGGPDTGTLDLSYQGAQNVRIIANGNSYLNGGSVGIGTPIPSQKLDVVGGYARSDTGFCIGSNCITTWPSSSGGTITGSGSTNYLAKFTGGSSIGNSLVTDDGTTTTHTGAARFTGYGTDSWFPYTNGTNYLRGNLQFNGTLYDENDNGYYINPNGTSIFNDLRANIFYDNNNTGYYVDPSGNTRLNNGYIGNFLLNWPGYGGLVGYYGNYIYPGWNDSASWNQSYFIYGNSGNSGLRTNGNWLVDGNIYWGSSGVWLSSWFNQNVRTDAGPTFNDVYANNWFRVNGSGGIYWQAYGGGWYMQDSTWIRSYNSKPVYMSAGFDTGSPSGVGCGGGLGGGYTFRVCGSQQVTSTLTTTGIYNTGGYLYSNNAGSGDIWLPYTNGNTYLRSPVNYITNTIQGENGSWSINNSGVGSFSTLTINPGWGVVNINGNQIWTNSGALYFNYSNGQDVRICDSANCNLYLNGNKIGNKVVKGNIPSSTYNSQEVKSFNISFGTTFSSPPSVVTQMVTTSTAYQGGTTVQNITTTGFTVLVMAPWIGPTTTNIGVSWIAVGD